MPRGEKLLTAERAEAKKRTQRKNSKGFRPEDRKPLCTAARSLSTPI